MDQAANSILQCGAAGAQAATSTFALFVAAGFIAFNSIRIFLYLPQLRTCLRDRTGCASINLWTWSGWMAANFFTGLYMWTSLGDGWGLALNMSNAGMCAATVAVTMWKRRRYRRVGDTLVAAA